MNVAGYCPANFYLVAPGNPNDKLVARGELGAAFAALVAAAEIRVEPSFGVTHFSSADDRLRIGAGPSSCSRLVVVDELIVATGFRPDFSFVSELHTRLDPTSKRPPRLRR